mgnify:CR=1 FL=1
MDIVAEAFLKALLSAGFSLPRKNVLLTIGGESSKLRFLEPARKLHGMGLRLYATEHTSNFLRKNGIPNTRLYKVHENREPNIRSAIAGRKIDFVISIPNPEKRVEFDSDYRLRRMAVDFSIPILTNLQVADLFVQAIADHPLDSLAVKHWAEYE